MEDLDRYLREISQKGELTQAGLGRIATVCRRFGSCQQRAELLAHPTSRCSAASNGGGAEQVRPGNGIHARPIAADDQQFGSGDTVVRPRQRHGLTVHDFSNNVVGRQIDHHGRNSQLRVRHCRAFSGPTVMEKNSVKQQWLASRIMPQSLNGQS